MPEVTHLEHHVYRVELDRERLLVELWTPAADRHQLLLRKAEWVAASGIGAAVDVLRVTEAGGVSAQIRAAASDYGATDLDWARLRHLEIVDGKTGQVVVSAVGEDWSLAEAAPWPPL